MDPQQAFDALETSIDKTLQVLDGKLAPANDELYQQFQDFYYELDRDKNGKIKSTAANLQKISKFSKDFSLDGTTYEAAVHDYFGEFDNSAGLVDGYFKSIGLDVGINQEFYAALLQANVQDTANKLLSSGIDANFKDPLIKILRDNVSAGSDKKAFMQVLKENIVTTPKLSRYVNQVASDSITQFNSNYINTISKDLGLAHYYYKGTLIKDSRPFCKKLAGKYITQEQLQAIVEHDSQGKGWAGMIAGTNWTNFPIYRGGWNCRHYLVPVTKALYDRSPNKY